MSDSNIINPIKLPDALMQQLRDSDAQLTSIKKVMEGLKEMGIDVRDLEQTYSTVSRAREALLKAFG